MLTYSWLDLRETKKLTQNPNVEIKPRLNSFFTKKIKKVIPDQKDYLHSLDTVAQQMFSFPVTIPSILSIGIKESDNPFHLVWIETPFVVFRFYLPVSAKLRGVFTKSSKGDSGKKQQLWIVPTYRLGQGAISCWSRTRTLISANLGASLFGHMLSFSIVGYNYSVQYKQNHLIFTLGYSHTNVVKVPKGILVKTFNKRQLVLYGANKVLVTTFAARLRTLKKVNVFTGKGLKLDSKVFKIKKRGS